MIQLSLNALGGLALATTGRCWAGASEPFHA
jgi:hypothetical protein